MDYVPTAELGEGVRYRCTLQGRGDEQGEVHMRLMTIRGEETDQTQPPLLLANLVYRWSLARAQCNLSIYSKLYRVKYPNTLRAGQASLTIFSCSMNMAKNADFK
jgi:hypothetical protein